MRAHSRRFYLDSSFHTFDIKLITIISRSMSCDFGDFGPKDLCYLSTVIAHRGSPKLHPNRDLSGRCQGHSMGTRRASQVTGLLRLLNIVTASPCTHLRKRRLLARRRRTRALATLKYACRCPLKGVLVYLPESAAGDSDSTLVSSPLRDLSAD